MLTKKSRKTVALAMLAATAYRNKNRVQAGKYLKQIADLDEENFNDVVEEVVDVLEDDATQTSGVDKDPFMDGTQYDNDDPDDVTASEDTEYDDESYDDEDYNADPEVASLTKTLRKRTISSNTRLVQVANAAYAGQAKKSAARKRRSRR